MSFKPAKLIDTNVAMSTEDKSIDPKCRLACVDVYEQLERGDFRIVVDLFWIINGEYQSNLDSGDDDLRTAFLNLVVNNFRNPDVCVTVKLTKQGDTFKEFPTDDPALEKFDKADHKWIAAAIACGELEGEQIPPIVQATDHDWRRFEDAFRAHEIIIEFICEQPPPRK